MAVGADIGRIDMGRVLARSIGAVVATDAIARDVRVIEVRRYPRDRRVAVVTIFTARDMSRVFAGRRQPIVARIAAPENLRVIDGEDG